MKRLTILTLVAGIMVTGSVLGMDHESEIEFMELWNDVIEMLNTKQRDALKSTAGRFDQQSKKLKALKTILKKVVDSDEKQVLLDRITALESPATRVPARVPATSIVTNPLGKETPAPIEYTPEFPGAITIDIVDPALLTCRPPTTERGTVTTTEATDDTVAPVAQPVSGTKKTRAVHNPDSQTTKLSALGIVRSPVFFMGVVGLSALAAITYAYFKKDQKTKNATDDDAQEDTNITESILLA